MTASRQATVQRPDCFRIYSPDPVPHPSDIYRWLREVYPRRRYRKVTVWAYTYREPRPRPRVPGESAMTVRDVVFVHATPWFGGESSWRLFMSTGKKRIILLRPDEGQYKVKVRATGVTALTASGWKTPDTKGTPAVVVPSLDAAIPTLLRCGLPEASITDMLTKLFAILHRVDQDVAHREEVLLALANPNIAAEIQYRRLGTTW